MVCLGFLFIVMQFNFASVQRAVTASTVQLGVREFSLGASVRSITEASYCSFVIQRSRGAETSCNRSGVERIPSQSPPTWTEALL